MVLRKTRKTKPTLKESEKKWGKAAMAAGFSIVPNTLFTKQHALGLDCFDIVIILQIHKHWWQADAAPFPSQVQLAKTMNTDISTVKRHLTRLRKDGLIDWSKRSTKHGGRAANAYDLSGLIKHLKGHAEEELREREKRAAENKERLARKRARPTVHESEDDDND
jgi:predicted transcriptional regulator